MYSKWQWWRCSAGACVSISGANAARSTNAHGSYFDMRKVHWPMWNAPVL